MLIRRGGFIVAIAAKEKSRYSLAGKTGLNLLQLRRSRRGYHIVCAPNIPHRPRSGQPLSQVADLLRGSQLFRNKLPLANRACVYGVQSVCQITHMCLRGHAVSTNVSTNVSWFAPGLRVLQLFRNKLPLPNMACAKWCAKCDLLVIYW